VIKVCFHDLIIKIVPMMNPTGYEYALNFNSSWIKTYGTDDDVNLNRNWNFNFDPLEPSYSENYGGKAPKTADEVSILSKYLNRYQWSAMIVLNSAESIYLETPEFDTSRMQSKKSGNFFRKMDPRIRKYAAKSKIKVLRPTDHTGHPVDWAIHRDGDNPRDPLSYAFELFVQSSKTALSENLQKTIEMTNHVAKLIKNEKSIKKNFIDEYIWREDEHFEYSIGNEPTYYENSIEYKIDLTSLQWLNETIVDRSIWKHDLHVIVPRKISDPDALFLHITWGDNPSLTRSHSQDVKRTRIFAESSGVVSAVLKQIPNQPTKFVDSHPRESDLYGNGGRYEDGILAKSWKMFIDSYNSGNPDYELLVMPAMAKAAVRALDATSEFLYRKTGNYPFNVGLIGASKRAWTSWLVAAADYERVDFVAPVMFDIINIEEQLKHHYKSLGGWTNVFQDYWLHDVTKAIGTDAMNASLSVIDVLNYADRYHDHVTTYIVNAGNDEFMMLSNPQFYMDKMSPKTLLRILPNQGHGGVWGGWDAPRQSDNIFRTRFLADPLTAENSDMDRLWTSVEALFMTVLENPGLIPQISTELKTVCVPSCEEDPDRSTQIIARVENNKIYDSTKGWISLTSAVTDKRDWRLHSLGKDYEGCTVDQTINDGLWEFEPPNGRRDIVQNFEDSSFLGIPLNSKPEEFFEVLLVTGDSYGLADNPNGWVGGFIDFQFTLNGREFIASSVPGASKPNKWIKEEWCGENEPCNGCLI